tara:strand:- start:979 stop:1980 length:1002 start_codon:yes stop_codon:yes gene_type:complete
MALSSHSHSQLTPEQKSIFADALFNPVAMKYYKHLYDRFRVELNTNNANKVVKRIHKYVAGPKNFDIIKREMGEISARFISEENQITESPIKITSIEKEQYRAYRNGNDLVNSSNKYNDLDDTMLFNELHTEDQAHYIFNTINQTIKDNKYKEDKEKKYTHACNSMLFNDTLRDEMEHRLHQENIAISRTMQRGVGNRKTAMADLILFDTMSKHIEMELFHKNSKTLETKIKNIVESKTQNEFKKTYNLFMEFLTSFLKLFPGCKKEINKKSKRFMEPIASTHINNKNRLSQRNKETQNELKKMKKTFVGEGPEEYVSIQKKSPLFPKTFRTE